MTCKSTRSRSATWPHLRACLLFAGLAALVLTAASCGSSSAKAAPSNPAAITNISRDTAQTNDFLRFSWVSPGTPVTSLGRPGALRAFLTATSFFQPALPLSQTATYPGLEDQPAQDLVVLRCIPPEKEPVDAILATWPNVFAAVQRDLGSQSFTCPYTGNSADHEIYCIAKQFDDTPSGVVVTTLANVLATANTLFDPAHPELAKWLKTYYGIYPAFSGLGFSVKDSYNLSSSNPTTSAEVLQKSVVPEYLLANVSLSDAGCRCIRVAPYAGRDQANIEPDFVWNKGGVGSCAPVPAADLQ